MVLCRAAAQRAALISVLRLSRTEGEIVSFNTQHLTVSAHIMYTPATLSFYSSGRKWQAASSNLFPYEILYDYFPICFATITN